MKIAQIICTYPPYRGGMGNSVFEASKYLRKLGNEVEVFTPFYTENEIKLPNVNYEKPIFSFGKAARIKKFLDGLTNFDIVHLHYPFFGTASLVAKWKKENPKIPLVITYHMDATASGWKGLIFKLYSKILMPKILNSADALIASTFDFVENSQAKNIHKKTKEKWHEVPFGVDIERFKIREKDEKLFEKYNLDKNKKTILFVGGMDKGHHFKGVPVLLEALKKLQTNNWQCILVGEGDLREGFIKLTNKLGLNEKVKFVGNVSEELLPKYYNLADLFVLPSVSSAEAFGIVLLEAMASSVPVVATNLPGVRKIARKGGEVAEINNSEDLIIKIESVLERYEHKNLKIKLQEIIKKEYSWEISVCKLLKIYKKLI
ncbi:MAG: glycosyltransferase family 4 protein [Candidatus Magasanikbacteria bacterium]|nr:glycosyltransferase family 4 protein [Candidatus Magasanikbacteria bacterium]